jgi:hypothetical protein
MRKLMSILAAAATVATVPAVSAIPASANAAVRVVVGAPGFGFYYGGRHYRHRVWRDGGWFYYDPYMVAPAYGYSYGYVPAYGYAPAYGYYGRYHHYRHHPYRVHGRHGRFHR